MGCWHRNFKHVNPNMYPELRTTVEIGDLRRKGFLWTGGIEQVFEGQVQGLRSYWVGKPCGQRPRSSHAHGLTKYIKCWAKTEGALILGPRQDKRRCPNIWTRWCSPLWIRCWWLWSKSQLVISGTHLTCLYLGAVSKFYR